ncbi:MAG: SIMPL domain-containing protein [Prevotellaceae bacterium]|jgi:hypothetical protein|nr:SIMPL domain-containing protein [Prevotellaceae bacterium]
MLQKIQIAVAGTVVAIGLILLGVCINKGLQSFSNRERVVTVKGLAEKEFKASSAMVSISVSCSGDLPKELSEKTEKTAADIAAYLKTMGYEKGSRVSEIDIYDSKTYFEKEWQDDIQKYINVKKDRYKASKTLSFEIEDVEKAEGVKNKINLDLINKNLSTNVENIFTDYRFDELNSIKPELIAESTRNAREAGEQFAKDSKSKLGKIKTASQGQIDLRYNRHTQTARVISNIVFYLED